MDIEGIKFFDWKTDFKKEREEVLKKCKSEKPMNGEDIKKLVINHLKKHKYEYTTERGSGLSNPFDIVAGKLKKPNFENDSDIDTILGFEIKGDTDSFTRLPEQLRQYLEYCDEVYIILHKKKSPEWLPYGIGILRIYGGEIYFEKSAYREHGVGSMAEWSALLKAHGFRPASDLGSMLKITDNIRRKVLFNRFFGDIEYGSNQYRKHFPFTKPEIKLIAMLTFTSEMKSLKRKLKEISTKAMTLYSIVDVVRKDVEKGQTGIEDVEGRQLA